MYKAYYEGQLGVPAFVALEAKYGTLWRKGDSMEKRYNEVQNIIRWIGVVKAEHKLKDMASAAQYLTDMQQRNNLSRDKVGWSLTRDGVAPHVHARCQPATNACMHRGLSHIHATMHA